MGLSPLLCSGGLGLQDGGCLLTAWYAPALQDCNGPNDSVRFWKVMERVLGDNSDHALRLMAGSHRFSPHLEDMLRDILPERPTLALRGLEYLCKRMSRELYSAASEDTKVLRGCIRKLYDTFPSDDVQRLKSTVIGLFSDSTTSFLKAKPEPFLDELLRLAAAELKRAGSDPSGGSAHLVRGVQLAMIRDWCLELQPAASREHPHASVCTALESYKFKASFGDLRCVMGEFVPACGLDMMILVLVECEEISRLEQLMEEFLGEGRDSVLYVWRLLGTWHATDAAASKHGDVINELLWKAFDAAEQLSLIRQVRQLPDFKLLRSRFIDAARDGLRSHIGWYCESLLKSSDDGDCEQLAMLREDLHRFFADVEKHIVKLGDITKNLIDLSTPPPEFISKVVKCSQNHTVFRPSKPRKHTCVSCYKHTGVFHCDPLNQGACSRLICSGCHPNKSYRNWYCAKGHWWSEVQKKASELKATKDKCSVCERELKELGYASVCTGRCASDLCEECYNYNLKEQWLVQAKEQKPPVTCLTMKALTSQSCVSQMTRL